MTRSVSRRWSMPSPWRRSNADEAALSRLSTEEQEAIIGRVEMEYTYDELAKNLGKPSGDAARMAVTRALVRLAEEMQRGAQR